MKYKTIALLATFFGLSFFGFDLLSIGVIAYLFVTTTLTDSPLPRIEHQYFILGLAGLIVLELFFFNFALSGMFAFFLFSYINKNSMMVKNIRILKKEAVKHTDKIKNKIKNKDFES